MNSWMLCTLGTTEICFHPAMLLYALYATLTGHGMFIVISTLSILLHEGAHAVAACIFGEPPRSIELTPLGAVMRLEDEARLSPAKRGVMLMAGPLATLALCFTSIMLTKEGLVPVQYGRLLFTGNLGILLLNLLPALPLDGGRILSLLLSMFLPNYRVYQVMRSMGSFLGVGMIGLNVYASLKLGGWNLSLAFAGCCLLYCAVTATTTYAMAELRRLMDRKIQMERKGSVPCLCCAVFPKQPARMLLKRLPPNRCVIYLCLETGSMKRLGWITEHELMQIYLNKPDATMEDALQCVKNGGQMAELDTI